MWNESEAHWVLEISNTIEMVSLTKGDATKRTSAGIQSLRLFFYHLESLNSRIKAVVVEAMAMVEFS